MPSSSTNALMPGVSRLYFSQVVPALDAIRVIQSLSWLSPGEGFSFLRKLYSTEPASSCSGVCAAWKSRLKSVPDDDAHGKLQPMRRLKAYNFSSGARDTAHSMTS